MSTSQTVSTADTADRHRQFFALAMLSAGLIYLVKALEVIITGSAVAVLDYGIIALALCTVGFLIPAVITKLRLPSDQKLVYFSEDGYAAEQLRKSFKASWAASFLSLAALETVLPDFLAHLPAEVFIQIGLFVMLSVMSVTFLILNRS